MKVYKGDGYMVVSMFGRDWYAGWSLTSDWDCVRERGVLFEVKAGRAYVGWTR